MPKVNWLLLIGVLFLVLAVPVLERAGRRLWHRRHGRPWSSRRCLVFVVSWRFWRGRRFAALVIAPFLLVDLVFLSANPLKILGRRLDAAGSSAPRS